MSDIRNDEVGLFLARELETILSRSFEVSTPTSNTLRCCPSAPKSPLKRLLYLPHL